MFGGPCKDLEQRAWSLAQLTSLRQRTLQAVQLISEMSEARAFADLRQRGDTVQVGG